jgi:muramoyltetrapeptide carboxypeptidase LdcA involved in peptidoglycan recycling
MKAGMVKPQRLRAGDKIAAVSLSWGGPGTYPLRYEAGKEQLQDEFGISVVETPSALRGAAWLHENPQARADDLMAAFADPTVRAIFSTIGGDDSIRVLRHVDLDVIRSNPKILMGFSDTTVTHMACLKAGLVSFYGPALMTGFAENGGMHPYMIDSVRRTLFSSVPIGEVAPNTGGWTAESPEWGEPENQTRPRRLLPSEGWEFLQGNGTRRGHLVGGCIEVLDWLRGTDVWPADAFWSDAILFLETSEEGPQPEAVLRSLRVLAAMGILHKLSGLLFARPGGKVPPEEFKEYDQAILQVVAEEEGLTGLPIVTRMDFGHTDPVFVLPYGLEAEIDCRAQRFRILEGAVTD